MPDQVVREVEAMCRPEYKTVRRRLKRLGLDHMALPTLREHFDQLITVQELEFTSIDFFALCAAAKHAKVPVDVLIQEALRQFVPNGYYLEGAKWVMETIEVSADVVEDLEGQGIRWQTVGPDAFRVLVNNRLKERDAQAPERLVTSLEDLGDDD